MNIKLNLKKAMAAFTLFNVIPMLIFFAGLSEGLSISDSIVIGYAIAIGSYMLVGVLYGCVCVVMDGRD